MLYLNVVVNRAFQVLVKFCSAELRREMCVSVSYKICVSVVSRLCLSGLDSVSDLPSAGEFLDSFVDHPGTHTVS